ncbi:hypothetical protein [Bradyrhizobium sp. 159]|uniref:hypothetical protein n=1 Tax=Bradyrhizobium sp. 159 TaxID=2782632 RepID=UPI001FFA9A21|nr:hypothetical protein [Bradyrhizobium sp. 159]
MATFYTLPCEVIARPGPSSNESRYQGRAMAFKIASYLDRIGLAQVPTTLGDLLALQQPQMRAIPYENFDVLLGDNPI